MILPILPAMVALAIAGFGWQRATAWLGPTSAVAVVVAGGALASRVLADGPVTALDGQLRVDAVSVVMIILIGVVGAITSTSSIAHLDTELATAATTPGRARLYGILFQVTIAAMLGVVIADNLGIAWVAIEITTIATVLLVGHRRDRFSVEASWKYLVLASVGVATALLGTALVYFVGRQSGIDASHALNWTTLVDHAPQLDPRALRLAVGMVAVGYATKAGLAPVHWWLPDAYSQAPAPVAALMAGVLSAIPMYLLLRFKVIADITLGAGYMQTLLVVGALASLTVTASLSITQRDYKRLVAYSSIEHIGLIALAAAIGSPLAMAAALLHMVGNGLAKSVAFSATGEMLFITGTTRIGDVRGLLNRRPFVGGVFGLSIAALLGFPPFSILASEIAIMSAGVSGGLTWAIAIAAALLLVIFTTFSIHTLNMLTGDGDSQGDDNEEPIVFSAHQTSATAKVPLVAGLLAAAAVGITIWPIERLLHTAAEVLAR